MLSKYSDENRGLFIISNNEFEEIPLLDEEDKMLGLLEKKYSESIMDSPPYHATIINNKVFEIKSYNLAHEDEGYLNPFFDDIKILLINSNIEDVVEQISDIISEASFIFSKKINSNVLIDFDYKDSVLDKIIKRSIEKRNLKNPIMSILEDVIDGVIVENNKIISVSNKQSFISLKNMSEKYLVPKEVLISLNPHVDKEKLKSTDVIFIPLTETLDALNQSVKISKVADYINAKSKHIISKAIDQNK